MLALVLLTAGVGAPFRTHGSGRAFLFGSHHAAAHAAVVRVRAVSGGGVATGFRALAGVASGGAADGSAADDASARWCLASSSPLQAHPSSFAAVAFVRPKPPLRC
jgi:hypothetical protein